MASVVHRQMAEALLQQDPKGAVKLIKETADAISIKDCVANYQILTEVEGRKYGTFRLQLARVLTQCRAPYPLTV